MKPAYVSLSSSWLEQKGHLSDGSWVVERTAASLAWAPKAMASWQHSCRVWGAALWFLSGPCWPRAPLTASAAREPDLAAATTAAGTTSPLSMILAPAHRSCSRCTWFGPMPVPLAQESEALMGWVRIVGESSASQQDSQSGKFFRWRKWEGVLVNGSQMRRDVIQSAVWSMVAARYEGESFVSDRLFLIRGRWLCFCSLTIASKILWNRQLGKVWFLSLLLNPVFISSLFSFFSLVFQKQNFGFKAPIVICRY